MFTLKESHLKKLCKINSYQLPETEIIFFGIRGCLPVNDNNSEFKKEQAVYLSDTNYVNPRCTIGQWSPSKGTIAVFPGSTVPHLNHVKTAHAKGGVGANQMMTGFFHDYRKGTHKPGSATGHEAFRQTAGRPIRRTADDFDFDNDDRVEFSNPCDNLHSAWCMSINHNYYASAGCQVIVGYPKCGKRGSNPDSGPWKIFKENAYKISQQSFPYVLMEGRDAYRTANMGNQKQSARLRFGSKGDLVNDLQKALKEKGYYEGKIDGDFGDRTNRAVLKYQTDIFGPSADDGIVGPQTASALGLTWPEI
jgi:hypothetical protein